MGLKRAIDQYSGNNQTLEEHYEFLKGYNPILSQNMIQCLKVLNDNLKKRDYYAFTSHETLVFVDGHRSNSNPIAFVQCKFQQPELLEVGICKGPNLQDRVLTKSDLTISEAMETILSYLQK
ncbi:hypothetical protein K6119_08005 [Paracrocinitomix mangrovi]|uniref:hypothetical protein n=1 Tax=Paracrocinitomix mangrovi TaxID=2862509 RepID=UPI001C8E071B|nr:hypothetical protein [Paracrocinitomix mangrovi]UKN00212.1 hypothetical protein K6119_10755 [Paracrocinitomix mangrovi]UKN03455.1 hypothetical protein K6119_08005 [Paracrocinitomix mangrovi]